MLPVAFSHNYYHDKRGVGYSLTDDDMLLLAVRYYHLDSIDNKKLFQLTEFEAKLFFNSMEYLY